MLLYHGPDGSAQSRNDQTMPTVIKVEHNGHMVLWVACHVVFSARQEIGHV